MSESLKDLRARCAVLREMGVAHHDPSTGAVTFFAQALGKPLSKEEVADMQRAREESEEQRRDRVRFGASGGMQPGRLSPGEVEARNKAGAEEQARIARQNAKAREARAELDALAGKQ